MKILNLVICVLFAGFAALQFNDDPDDIWYWVFIYLAVSIVSACAAFNKYNMWAMLAVVATILFQMFFRSPALLQWFDNGMPSITGEMKASSPHVESVREFLGLFLCLGIMIFHYMRYLRLRRQAEQGNAPIY